MEDKIMCEIFNEGHCLGCEGLAYDIDKLKYECEFYKEQMGLTKEKE